LEVKEGIMQAQIEKGTLLSEYHEKATTETIKEITPYGVRLEVNTRGDVAGPSYTGHSVHTISEFLKTDGTVDWESKGLETTTEGGIVIAMFHGTLRMTGPNTYKSEGEGIYTTQSPKLSWLNNKKCRVEGTADALTGEFYAKVFAL
jgi:hypothetical protein